MKKLYFIAALAAIGLASCTSEEEVRTSPVQNEIGFKPVVERSTRTAVTSGYFSDDTPIYVTAIYNTGETGAKWVPFYGNAKDVWIEYTTTDAENEPWTSNPKFYYPTTGTLEFLAYSCGDPTLNTFTAEDQVKPSATTTLINETGEIDNVVLDFTTNKLFGATDVTYAFKTGATKTDAPQPMQFAHALAWLTIGITDATEEVKLMEVTVDDVLMTGKLTIPVENHALGTAAWTTTGVDPETVAFPKYTTTALTSSGTIANSVKDCPGLLVLPQAQSSITIKYKSASTGQKYTHKISLIDENDTDAGKVGPWAAGKHYHYNIIIEPKEIKFECTVDTYDDVYGTDGKEVEI